MIRRKLAALVKARLARTGEFDVGRDDCVQALLWLDGKVTTIDFKIESRFLRPHGVWIWRLLHGVAGHSAANILVEWVEPTEAERRASNAAARKWLNLP